MRHAIFSRVDAELTRLEAVLKAPHNNFFMVLRLFDKTDKAKLATAKNITDGTLEKCLRRLFDEHDDSC